MAVASTTCVLYLLLSTQMTEVKNLSPKDATAKYWEYAVHEHYPDVAMEAVYCGKNLVLILNNTNLDAIPGVKKIQPGTMAPEPEAPAAQ
jgi:hypothetical protein